MYVYIHIYICIYIYIIMQGMIVVLWVPQWSKIKDKQHVPFEIFLSLGRSSCKGAGNGHFCFWHHSSWPYFTLQKHHQCLFLWVEILGKASFCGTPLFLGNVMINQGIRLCLAHSEAETQRIISLSTWQIRIWVPLFLTGYLAEP